MKKFMTLLICTLISIVIVVVIPMLFHTFSFVRVESFVKIVYHYYYEGIPKYIVQDNRVCYYDH